MAHPIWQDNYYTLGTEDVYLYRVRLNNSSGPILYTGRAYKRPGASNVIICINDIIKNQLKQTLCPTTFSEGYDIAYALADGICKTIYLEKSTDGVNFSQVVTPEDFRIDKSYLLSNANGASYRWSDPITEVSINQPLWLTTDTGSILVVYTFIDGTTESHTYNVHSKSNISLLLSARPSLTSVTVTIRSKVTTYKVVPGCHDYALYYVNAFGGWDTLLIKGRVKVTDNYTRHNISLEYNNSDIINRGAENYANEVARVYTINTGWLPGDVGEKMHHLIGSTMVYLYDFSNDKFIPVTIDDTSCEYKSYRSEGDRPVNFTITATEAHDMTR